MRDSDKRKVLAALRERAAIDLDGLFDDLPAWPRRGRSTSPRTGAAVDRASGRDPRPYADRSTPRARAVGSPFERFLAEDEPPRGARDPGRRRDPIRQLARCHTCQREREGTTTFESMAYGERPVGYAIHFCDECEASIQESPIEEVLSELPNLDL
jgi:hypothetical protein